VTTDVPRRLQPHEIEANLASIPSWRHTDGKLEREFRFADFSAAFAFMTRVAEVANRVNHHPDWRNVWNRVEIALSTHDAGGITERDFALARAIDGVV